MSDEDYFRVVAKIAGRESFSVGHDYNDDTWVLKIGGNGGSGHNIEDAFVHLIEVLRGGGADE